MTANELRDRREASVRRMLRAHKGSPSVSIRGRQRETETDEDGTERTLARCGNAMLITIPDTSAARRNVTRWAERHGVALERLTPDNRPAKRSGNRQLGPEAAGTPEAEYRAIGPGSGLAAVRDHGDVIRWGYCVAVRVGMTATGSGPEKMRPKMDTVYGTPEQVASTAAALAARPREDVAADEFPDIRHDTELPASPADTSPDIVLDPKPTWPLPRREW